MDLNIILWIGGMLFSLGIFALKLAFGLGFSQIKWKGVVLTLTMYLVLFVLVAVLSGRLIQLLEPFLRKGPYLHALMAAGMVVWGMYLLRNPEFGLWNGSNPKLKNSAFRIPQSALLLLPCPVCLTAMTFSTWAALNVINLPAPLIGMGLGIAFILLSLAFYFSLKLLTLKSSPMTQKTGLGLSMIGIGLYYLVSLFLPAKIEEARGMYRAFLTEGNSAISSGSLGVFTVLFAAALIGFFANAEKTVHHKKQGHLTRGTESPSCPEEARK